jgi:uncharacterized protein (DUF302 family)
MLESDRGPAHGSSPSSGDILERRHAKGEIDRETYGRMSTARDMKELPYGFETRMTDTPFEQAVEKVTAALKSEGFGVLTEIDVADTLKKKLGIDFRRYMILGACNPDLAHQALGAEPQIGLLLPCNVVVQEAPEVGVIVSIAAPKAMFTMVDNASLTPVAEEAEARLRRVMAALG